MQWSVGQKVRFKHKYKWETDGNRTPLDETIIYTITHISNGCWEDGICHVCRLASDKQHYVHVGSSGPQCGSNFSKVERESHMPKWF